MASSNGGAQQNAQAQLNGIMQADSDKGRVAVHTFDPNSTPQEKAAAAGKSKDQLKSVNAPAAGEGGREVKLDSGNNIGVVPTITIEDADIIKKEDTKAAAAEDGTPSPPGALPTDVAPPIPDWYKVGWRAVSKIDEPPLPEGQEKDRSILDLFLAEQYYGEWYQNAALIVFAVFASHFLTLFHFGWGWLFIILAVCNTYYSTSMERVRRRARDDIQRELVKTRLASEHETADWINNFLDRFWLIYEPVLSQTIVASVDQILSASTPAFLDSIRLSTFTLGTKAPRIDKVRTFPRTADDIIMMDWGLSFTPNDVSDMTPRQAASKVNPKICLSIKVGKGIAAVSMPILLEDITFTGLMRIRMKLMTNFPHVQIVDISFLEKPVIDYVLKPIGGETFGMDIANIPGLSSFIRDMTHATLGPMMYDPNVFTLNLEQMLSGEPLDAAIGVLQVTLHNARGIKGVKIGGGSPDPFVGISINDRAELARTKYKHNTYNPTWQETKFILVNSLKDSLVLSLWDYNDHRKNTLLGAATFELASLQEDATQENIMKNVLKDGKDRGELKFDVNFYPVLKPEVNEGKESLPDTSVGIVRLTVHQAKDLDATKSMSGDLNPLAKVHLGNSSAPIHTTQRFKHTNNPVWESATEFLCSDKASSIITVKVIDDRDFLKDPVVGYVTVKLEDLLEAKKEDGRDWWSLSGCKSGRIRLGVEWKPLNMAGSLHGADQYSPPIGVVRLWAQKATDVKNVEATLGGKSDPYLRVQVGNVTKGRTEVVNNNLNPEWDAIIYIPVHSLRESLFMEVMDYQNLTKDRSLGSVELHVSELAKASSDTRYPYEATGKKTASDPIRLDKNNSYKGQLHYVAEFIPALALSGVKFEQGPNELQRAAEGSEGEDGDVALDGSWSSLDTSDDNVPEGVTVSQPLGDDEKKHKRGVSTDTTKTTETTGTTKTTETGVSAAAAAKNAEAKPKASEGITMSKDELLKEQSGIIVFNITSGQIAKKARLEVLLEDGYWPAFSTIKARSNNAQWDHVGEGFIKELDFGRVWLRLNEGDDGEKDYVVAEYKVDAKEFLQLTLSGPSKFTLKNEDGGATSTVQIESRYVPVPVKLEARESINNQGVLRIDLIDGSDIHGVDRGGKSDPFAVFSLNGAKVFKSQTKKKTLTPEWKETFNVNVPSRSGADFSIELFDWNQIEQAKSLGAAKIELADLEPFQGTERILNLLSPKHGAAGQVRIRLMFEPEIIAKARKNTSTFSAAGRAVTQIGGMPLGAGKGVLHGATGLFKKDKGDKEKEDVPPIPTGQASQPVGLSDHMQGSGGNNVLSSADAGDASSNEPGTLKVTVLDAKDLPVSDAKAYVTIRVGDKEHKTKHAHKTATPEWNESFTFTAGTFTPKLFVWVHDHKTLGKDKQLGEGDIDIWRHIQPKGNSSADIFAELREGGQLRLRLEFDATTNPNLGNSMSVMSADRASLVGSPSRFSIRGRRPGADKEGSD